MRERRRLERDLHDGAQQRLVSLALTLRMARETLGPDAGEAGRLLDRAAYFVVAEALTSVAKYASATRASVTMSKSHGRLAVEISDNGVGGADIDRGTSLRGLTDRLAAIDGQLEVDSRPGWGTTVRASIPCL